MGKWKDLENWEQNLLRLSYTLTFSGFTFFVDWENNNETIVDKTTNNDSNIKKLRLHGWPGGLGGRHAILYCTEYYGF